MTRFALLAALLVSLNGCFTPRVADAIGDLNQDAVEKVHARIVSLDRAVWTDDGVYCVEVSYSDDSSRVFAYDPLPPVTSRRAGALEPRSTLAEGGVEVSVGDGELLRLSGNTLLGRDARSRYRPLASFPTYTRSRRRSAGPAVALKKLAYVTLALPLALVGDVTIGALYGLFCTEAGWHVILAVATCLIR
jgi:hypothetical protein